MLKALGLARFVRRLVSHSDLSPDDQAALLSLPARSSLFEARTDFVTPGVDVDEVSLVVDGLAGRFDQLKAGTRQITALFIPGDMCDLHSLAVSRATFGLEALTATTIVQISHRDLQHVVDRHPAVAWAFLRDAAIDSAVLSKWVVNIGRKDASSAFAHLICEIGVRMERAGLGDRKSFRLPSSQAQMADALGLSTVHVNRTLQELRRGGVSFEKGIVTVRDWRRLADFGEFDDSFPPNLPPQAISPSAQSA